MAYLIAPERRVAESFVLRSYLPGDGPLLREALLGSYEHLRAFMPWASPDVDADEAERRVRTFRAQYLLSKDFVIGVFASDGSRLLGGTGFHLREGGIDEGSAEIGMWVRGDASARGLGTNILIEMLHWGFSEWPWERMTWRCRDDNDASQRVADKAGMHSEGVLRRSVLDREGLRHDTHCFAALRGEWKRPEPV